MVSTWGTREPLDTLRTMTTSTGLVSARKGKTGAMGRSIFGRHGHGAVDALCHGHLSAQAGSFWV